MDIVTCLNLPLTSLIDLVMVHPTLVVLILLRLLLLLLNMKAVREDPFPEMNTIIIINNHHHHNNNNLHLHHHNIMPLVQHTTTPETGHPILAHRNHNRNLNLNLNNGHHNKANRHIHQTIFPHFQNSIVPNLVQNLLLETCLDHQIKVLFIHNHLLLPINLHHHHRTKHLPLIINLQVHRRHHIPLILTLHQALHHNTMRMDHRHPLQLIHDINTIIIHLNITLLPPI